MMEKSGIAIITGASAGLGSEFVRKLIKLHPEIEEYWLIARRYDKMAEIASEFEGKTFKILTLDLSRESAFEEYRAVLEENKPDVKILINNAGYGRLGYFDELDAAGQWGMVDVNVRALTAMSRLTLDYMNEGSVILNVCSIASFAPTPRMTVYCSTKAYVLSFSKGLREELKRRKINVLASCPGPMDTEFFAAANIKKGTSPVFDSLPRVKPDVMAEKSIIKAFRGRAVYTNKLMFKLYRVLGKLLPHNLLMKFLVM